MALHRIPFILLVEANRLPMSSGDLVCVESSIDVVRTGESGEDDRRAVGMI